MMFRTFAFLLLFSAGVSGWAEEPKHDSRYAFRTDFANEHLPWYQLKPLEFPPHGSAHSVRGELVAVDFIHRSGVFRLSDTGELVSFTMPPFGLVYALNAPADLRDIPLGTSFLFALYQDENGAFTKVAAIQDDYTVTARQHANYRLNELKEKEHKLIVGRQKLPEKESEGANVEWVVSEETRFWKGEQQLKISDLAVGDELLANFAGGSPQHPRVCADVWIGVETHQQVTGKQKAAHESFIKERGLAAWISEVDGKSVTVELLSSEEPEDRKDLQEIVTAGLSVGKSPRLVVANDELRTYWPPVDGKRGQVTKVETLSADAYGAGGFRLTLKPVLMLEGFRKGRIVRLFPEKWTPVNMPFGEGLIDELTSAEANEVPPKEYPSEFLYRTDYGNRDLAWYQLKEGEIPPRYSEHKVYGELVSVDCTKRTGQFRTDRTGELVDFSLSRDGAFVYVNINKKDNIGPILWDSIVASVMFRGTPSALEDLALGVRYCFHLYQDDKGQFTRASLVTDEFSSLLLNKVTWRIESLNLEAGMLQVARHLPPRKQMRLGGYDQPPDIGRAQLRVDETTCVWKDGRQVQLKDLAVGDELFVNLSGETATTLSRCTEIWSGENSRETAAQEQKQRVEARGRSEKAAPTK